MNARSFYLLGFYFTLICAVTGCQASQGISGGATNAPINLTIAGAKTSPNSSTGDLLYAANMAGDTVDVFSYPDGALMQTLTGFNGPLGECSDADGNVFITNVGGQGVIDEYAHGATSPSAVLTGAATGNGSAVVT